MHLRKLFFTVLIGFIFTLALLEEEASAKKLLDAPHIKQLPELPRGCEVTSLAMMLLDAGAKADKMTLAKQIKKVPFKQNGLHGNPYDGFVGNMYTYSLPGYGVYNGPIAELAEDYLPGRIVNLTGLAPSYIYKMIDKGSTVWVITNSRFRALPASQFQTWNTSTGKVSITYREHSVLVTGYDSQYVYINDPLYKTKNRAVSRKNFEASWVQMGRQAISYYPKNQHFFADTIGHWAEKEINRFSELEYINGYKNGLFKPNDSITRSQQAIMTARVLNLPLENRKSPSFKDLSVTYTEYKAVAALVEEGILQDGAAFSGTNALTRAEMSKILAMAFKLPLSGTKQFTDVSDASWALPYIQTIYEYGITSGYSNGTFKPNDQVTRAQFSVFLTRAMEKLWFTDIYKHWARDDISMLKREGIIKGESNGSFRPNASISRAEAAVMLDRSIDLPEAGGFQAAFKDLPANHFSYSSVMKLVQAGILSDSEAFRPNDEMSRQEFARVIALGYKLNYTPADPVFTDVPPDHGFYEAIQALAQNNITKGNGSGQFSPGSSITRAEFASLLARAYRK